MPGSNKFTKAMHHLRSTQIDERIRALNEGPTNNTSGYYVIEPDTVTVIPAVRSDLDLTADDPSLLGKDTSGLFDQSGNPLTEMPPGDTSFILGPMVSVYFPDGEYSAIGYIQKDTRKVINLARIPGRVSEWATGGNVEGFVSYSQLTLEQALWYRDKLINGNTSTYRVFYVGVFEQLNSESDVTDPSTGVDVDEYGRWEGEVTDQGEILEPEKTEVTPGKKGPDPDMPPGIANPAFQKLRDKFKRGENLTIDDFPSAADFSAFKNGGGNAALRQGKTIGEVIRQGVININGYNSGARLPDYDDYMGPAFGNDSVANRERQKAVDARNDALYNYWRDNYVNPDTSVNPQGLTQKQIDDMPDWYRDLSTPPDPNNFAGAFKDTPVGQAVNDFMNDPTHGWWRQAALELGVGALGAALGKGKVPSKGKGLARGKGFTVGATGLKKGGFDALKGGQNLHKGSKGILTNPLGQKQVYAAPTVGQRGPSAFRPGTGGSRYVEYGSNPFGGAQGKSGQAGGVVGSVVPPRARRIGGPEPQSAVDPKTFQKGQRIFQKAFDPKYANTPTAQRIRQQAGQAGFGASPNIPASQLPTTSQPSVKSGGKPFSKFSQSALGSGASAAAAAGMIGSQPEESGEKVSTKSNRRGRRKQQKQKQQKQEIPPVEMPIIKQPRGGSNMPTPSAYELIDQDPKKTTIASRGKSTGRSLRSSNELEGKLLAENRRRILHNIKKPYELPEAKTEKIKHRPNANRWSTRSVGDGLMKRAEVPTSFKRLEDNVWKKQDRHWNERYSQERKNMILDAVGTSDHAWEYITDRSASGNDAKMYENFGQGIKNQIIEKKKIGNDYIIKMYNEEGNVEIVTQSILNERLQRQHELKEQETIYAPKDPLVARIRNKLYSQIDYPNKPAKLGYPDEPPKQMIGGYHPEFGDRHSYYNRLDRHSADTMQNAPTQDMKIDMKVQKQTTMQKTLNIINNIRAAKAQYAKATKKNK